MAKINTVQRVEEIVKPFAEELGLSIWDITYKKEGSDWYLRIFIDKDGGVSIDDCVEVSRLMNPILDKEDYIDEPYTFEVSSPGVERLLRKEWHYKKAIGETVFIKTFKPYNGTKELYGTLDKFYEDHVIISLDDEAIKIKREDIAICRIHEEF